VERVSHFSRLSRIVVDAPPDDHDRELAFWQEALGRTLTHVQRFPAFHAAALPGHDFGLLVQRMDEGAPRIHLDIHTDDLDAEVARLQRHGAVRVGGARPWQIMRDPAGMLFCVVPLPPEQFDEGNATRWD
jgi:predicted enzyme related to lactoylglutathione lyase